MAIVKILVARIKTSLDMGLILDQENPMAEEMATHSSFLAWKIPWTEEPGKQSPWDCKESDKTEHAHTQQH